MSLPGPFDQLPLILRTTLATIPADVPYVLQIATLRTPGKSGWLFIVASKSA